MAKGDIKMRPRAQRDQICSSTLSASSFTSRGKCSHWYRQAGTQIRCSEHSDEHRLGLEGTTHSSQNVISMQMKGAGIRDRKVEMVTSPVGCHGDWNLISSESSGAWSRWIESKEGRRRERNQKWGTFKGNNTPMHTGGVVWTKKVKNWREQLLLCCILTTHDSFSKKCLINRLFLFFPVFAVFHMQKQIFTCK